MRKYDLKFVNGCELREYDPALVNRWLLAAQT